MVVRSDPRRCSDDGGAILVEAAFISPILFYLLFGVLEYSMVMRSYLTIGNGLRAAGRIAAIDGNDGLADYDVIQAVKRETAAMSAITIEKLIVYKANPSTPLGDPKPITATACLSAAVPSTRGAPDYCNIYEAARDIIGTPGSIRYGCSGANNFSAGWCPTTRFQAATAAGTPVAGPPDTVGVYIEVRHKYVTGLFGTTKTLSDTVFNVIEPKSEQ